MLFNKNNYRKAGEKKVLHKVGKEWKVVSVALLMAIAGGAAATHANANADANVDDNATDVTVAQLNTSATANPPRNAAKSSAPSSVASSSASGGPYYYSQANNGFSGYNGSAASYFDNVSNENKVMDQNRPLVNSYVQSLNAEYNPVMHSFGVKSASAQSAASNDSKLAKSYAATARNTNTFNTINSLAAKNNMGVDEYTNMVQNNEQYYSNGVKNASADVKAASDVTSLVNKLETANLSEASLKASMASGIAASNYNGANAVLNSVHAKWDPYEGHDDNDAAGVAAKLSDDADVFAATGNALGNDADYSALLNAFKSNAPLSNAVSKAVNAAVNSAYSNASSAVVSASKNGSLGSLANSANSDGYFVSEDANGNTVDNANSALNSNANVTSNGSSVDLLDAPYASNYVGAVSAANNYSMAAYFHSVANSLVGSNNTAYNNSYAMSVEGSKAIASASAKALAAYYASDFAYINSSVVTDVIGDVAAKHGMNSSEAQAAVASDYLSEGVDKVASEFGYLKNATDTYEYINNFSGTGNYASALDNSASAQIKKENSSTNGNNGMTSAGNAISSAASNLVNDSSAISEYTAAQVGTTGIMANAESNEANVHAQFSADYMAVSSAAKNFNSALFNAQAAGTSLLSGTAGNAGSYKASASFASILTSGMTGSEASLTSNLVGDTNVTNSSVSNNAYLAGSNITSIKNSLSNAASAFSYLATNAENVSASTDDKGSFSSANGLSLATNINTSAYVVANPEVQYTLLSQGVDLDALSDESGAISDIATAVSSASASSVGANNYSASSSVANLANALNTATSSANSAEDVAQTSSASYSAANDENVTLSSYFASSYATDADNSSEASVDENNSLAGFLESMTGKTSDFDNALDAYNNAEYAAATDYKLGVGYAQAIYNNHAHFLDVLKNAKLHSTPDFGSKNFNDKVVGSVNKGDRLTVYGVNVSRNNNWRGVVRYYVKDNTNGKQGFVTGQSDYTKAAYLPSLATTSDVEVKTLKPVNVYDQENGGKVVAQLPAGKVLENADVVYDNADEDAYGFTKVETASDDYLTANTDYVQILNPTVNKPANNTPSEFNFNLGNGQNMATYYNNLSQN